MTDDQSVINLRKPFGTIRELFGADKAVIVTSSEFTSTAKEAAQTYGDSVELVNGPQLVRLLSRSGLAPPTGRTRSSSRRSTNRQRNATNQQSSQSGGQASQGYDGDTTFCMVCGRPYQGGLYEVTSPSGETVHCCARCRELLEEEIGASKTDVANAAEMLGVQLGACDETVKNAYREKVLEVHPDNGGSQEAFIEVREAYELLLDHNET
jgi:hypothetical protein